MPSSDKSCKWFCNVDGSKEFLTEKVKVMANWVDCTRLLSAYHLGAKGENPHCHWVIELSSELQRQSYVGRLKKLFGIEKNTKGWSVQIWKDDGACSYLFHEQDECILFNKGFTEDDLARYRKLNEDVQKVVAINKERGGNRVVERVLGTPGIELRDRRWIATELFGYIRRGEMYEPGDFRLKAMIEEIYLKSREDDEWEAYCVERCERLFKFG